MIHLDDQAMPAFHLGPNTPGVWGQRPHAA